jgi:hypothetical protein
VVEPEHRKIKSDTMKSPGDTSLVRQDNTGCSDAYLLELDHRHQGIG